MSSILLHLFLTLAASVWSSPANTDTMTLFEFDSPDEAAWQIVNDGVMGGRSKGYFAIQDGSLRFDGELVTRGGGFTSVRTNRSFDLSGYEGLELRVRGGGRVFEVDVDDGTRRGWRSVSRRAAFQPGEEWTWIRVPFGSLRTSVFGQAVSAPAIDVSRVRGLGLFIVDGQDGPFRLEVDAIRAFRSDDS